jgi:hypothetical protein
MAHDPLHADRPFSIHRMPTQVMRDTVNTGRHTSLKDIL